jgi:hypothetical protein
MVMTMSTKRKKEAKQAIVIVLGFLVLIVGSIVTLSPEWANFGELVNTRIAKPVVEINDDAVPLGALPEDTFAQANVKVLNDVVTVRFSFNPQKQNLEEPVMNVKFKAFENDKDITNRITFDVPKMVSSMGEVNRIEALDVKDGYIGCKVIFRKEIAHTVKGEWTFQLTDTQNNKLAAGVLIESEAEIADGADENANTAE